MRYVSRLGVLSQLHVLAIIILIGLTAIANYQKPAHVNASSLALHVTLLPKCYEIPHMFCTSKPNACQSRLHSISLAAAVVAIVVFALIVASGSMLAALIHGSDIYGQAASYCVRPAHFPPARAISNALMPCIIHLKVLPRAVKDMAVSTLLDLAVPLSIQPGPKASS